MNNGEKLKCGVVGVGYLGQHHARIYSELETTELVGVCDADPARAREIADRLGCRVFGSAAELGEACELSVKAGADYVKTSTGFPAGGATISDVALMKDHVEGKCKVKAAGGIRDYNTAAAMIDAGADRLGTSATIKIMEGKQ